MRAASFPARLAVFLFALRAYPLLLTILTTKRVILRVPDRWFIEWGSYRS